MFGPRITLFRIFGFAVRFDLSWIVIAVIVAALAASGLRASVPGASSVAYWIMGACVSLGLFASVVFHELCHSLVARRVGIRMKGITLFIFGGVAEMEDEPQDPAAEFWMAVVGPIASAVLAASFLTGSVAGPMLGWPAPVSAVLGALALMNLALALFNLLPAFPLDGGRVLRAALWAWKGDLRWSTRIASGMGVGFGTLMILGGIALAVFGTTTGLRYNGIWLALIGFFLRNAAQAPYQQLILRESLGGEPVRRFMKTDVITVPRAIPISELVEQYVYVHHYKMFPVVDADRLLGCVTLQQVKGVPRDEWDMQSVGTLAVPCSPENTIDAGADALEALMRMSKSGVGRLMVVEDDHLVGILSLRDLLSFLSLKMELEPR